MHPLQKVYTEIDPVPSPRNTRSFSSVGVFLVDWADETYSIDFMRLFLSDRPEILSVCYFSDTA
jgi:hypothetical protein